MPSPTTAPYESRPVAVKLTSFMTPPCSVAVLPNGFAAARQGRSRNAMDRKKTERLPFLHLGGLKSPSPACLISTSPTRGALMSVVAPDRRMLLRLTLCWIALGLGTPSAAIASDATAPVEQLHTGLIEIMKAGRAAPFRQRYDKIAPVIGRTFDLEAIVRQVIGLRWTSLPADQQATLTDAFRRYTIASYVANFDGYSGERLELVPAVTAVGNDRVVQTRIVSGSGQEDVLAYVMRQSGG